MQSSMAISKLQPLQLAAKGMMAASVMTAIFGSFLTACGAFGVLTEFFVYWLCFLFIGLAGSVLVLSNRQDKRCRLMVATATLCLLCMAIAAEYYSNSTFLFWKLRLANQAEWKRKAESLKELAKSDETDSKNLSYGILDSSLRGLGSASDFCGGQSSGVNPILIFGVKSRRWGLVIGEEPLKYGQRAKFKRVRVAENAWFFVGYD